MYTLLDYIKHKCRDSYVLYIPTVHAFGYLLLTHTLLVQTHTWYRHITFPPPAEDKMLTEIFIFQEFYVLMLSYT